MAARALQFILGSRSPRRRELLGHIVPPEQIVVVPPLSTDEPDFDGLHTWPQIENRLQQIAQSKCDDVLQQVHAALSVASARRTSSNIAEQDQNEAQTLAAVITADTVIVARDRNERLVVLEQPPEDDSWPDVVRRWFREYYFGRTHTAATAVCVETLDGRRADRIVKSEVAFRADGERWLQWYISTGQPRGKAGGYAIQQAGSVFVERVDGSLSNVVGLPLEAVLDVFEQLGIA